MRFEFRRLTIPDVLLVIPRKHRDDRGWFMETWREEDFREAGIPPFVQENHSHSVRGVLRGLHLQRPPTAQGKLVRCTRGKIFDVAVDVRPDSDTYGSHVAATLDDSGPMLWIPEGFAHGFQAIEDSDVLYKVTRPYSPGDEACVRWDSAGVAWPLAQPRVSAKDLAGVPLDAFRL